jgi:2-polyprenyl-6-methoxyphenol hydroxylase-like FAD-dependent oxidoreductase
MASQNPILVIGAGISGLTLARTLIRHRLPVIVFDSMSAGRSQGYGITLRSWAYDKFIDPLGISPEELKRHVATDAPLGRMGKLDAHLWDAYTGKVLIEAPPTRPGSNEGDFFRANRSRIRDFLSEGVDVRFEHRLISFEVVGGGVKAKFNTGEEVEGQMLIGADGVNSTGNVANLRLFFELSWQGLSPQHHPPEYQAYDVWSCCHQRSQAAPG